MSDFTPLREAVDTLAGRTASPDFGELQRRATRRGRRRVGMAAAASAAVVAVGGGLAVGSLDGSDRVAPVEEPTTPSPEPPQPSESAEAGDLGSIVGQVSGWALDPLLPQPDRVFSGPCSRSWDSGSTGGGSAGGDFLRFPTAAQASDAADRLVENLESCTTTAWRTQPIAQTGTVLATAAFAVAWIQQNGDKVDVLQLPTADGPPPLDVQVEVAEWVVAASTDQNALNE